MEEVRAIEGRPTAAMPGRDHRNLGIWEVAVAAEVVQVCDAATLAAARNTVVEGVEHILGWAHPSLR